jgi:hypothetical protein
LARIATVPEPDRLERIVTLVDAAVAGRGWHRPHLLLAVEGTPEGDEVELHLRELAGAHPVDEVLGFRAPPSWTAMGAVTYGWAAPLDGPDGRLQRPSRHPDRCRARVTSVVDRTGREVVTTSLADGRVIDEPGVSVLADALRRCLGAPTAAPPPLRELVDVLWTEAVLAAVDAGGIRRWDDVLALRPRPTSWSHLRRVARDAPGFGALAEWMDDGMFARWLLGGHRPLPALLEDADRRLDRPLALRLRAHVEGAGTG